MPNPCDLDLFADPALTRRIARERSAGVSAHHRRELLDALTRYGPQTADAAGALVGLGPLSARPRIAELAKDGVIEATGDRGQTASGNPCAIWRVV